MSGLRRICKMYGRMKIGDTMWVWDHVKDEPVREKDMSRERWAASERKKWEAIKEQLNTKTHDGK